MPIVNWLKSAYCKYHQQTFLTVFANFLWVQNRVKFCVFWHPSWDRKNVFYKYEKEKKNLLCIGWKLISYTYMNKNKKYFHYRVLIFKMLNCCILLLRLLSCRLALLKKEKDNSVWSFTFPYPMYNSFQCFFTANVRRSWETVLKLYWITRWQPASS